MHDLNVFIVNFKINNYNDNNNNDNNNAKSVERLGCKHCNRRKPKTISLYLVRNTDKRLVGLL